MTVLLGGHQRADRALTEDVTAQPQLSCEFLKDQDLRCCGGKGKMGLLCTHWLSEQD